MVFDGLRLERGVATPEGLTMYVLHAKRFSATRS